MPGHSAWVLHLVMKLSLIAVGAGKESDVRLIFIRFSYLTAGFASMPRRSRSGDAVELTQDRRRQLQLRSGQVLTQVSER